MSSQLRFDRQRVPARAVHAGLVGRSDV